MMNYDFLRKGDMNLNVFAISVEELLCHLKKRKGYVDNEFYDFEREEIVPHTQLLDIVDIKYKTQGIDNPEINIIWEPSNAPGFTVFRSSLSDGRYTLAWKLAKGGLDCYRFEIHNEALPGYFFYRLSPYLESKRVVHYIDEGSRKVFYQDGDLLPFEKPEYYERKKKKDRMNPEIIVEYMSAMGWNILDENFWTSTKKAYKDVIIWKNKKL
jgi:hypothetical protein